jgi:hypothetical protein
MHWLKEEEEEAVQLLIDGWADQWQGRRIVRQ